MKRPSFTVKRPSFTVFVFFYSLCCAIGAFATFMFLPFPLFMLGYGWLVIQLAGYRLMRKRLPT